MQTKVLLVCAMVLPVVGTVTRPATHRRAKSTVTAARPVPVELRNLLDEGKEFLRKGRYVEAARTNLQGYQESTRKNETQQAIRFLNNLGASYFASFRYRQAMETFSAARRLCELTQEWPLAVVASLNISSLYLQMGEAEAAADAASRGLREIGRSPESTYRSQLLAQLARVRAVQGNFTAAEPLFIEAITEADRRGDPLWVAQVWNQLGLQSLNHGRLDLAERALTEAFRLRRLNGNRDLGQSYQALGTLRLKQGDLVSARTLAGQAVDWTRRHPGRMPNFTAYYLLGRALLAQGNLPEAVENFRQALDTARGVRLEALPADPVRVGLDVELHDLYSAFVAAAARLYRQRPSAALLAEIFEASEENRAASLRALIFAREWPSRLPPEYGEALARLREARYALLLRNTPGGHLEVLRLEAALARMENEAGLESGAHSLGGPVNVSLLEATRAALGPDECLLTFHLGDEFSYLWAVTRSGAELHRLPARDGLERQVAEFGAAVADGSPTAAEMGQRLYSELFGSLGNGSRAKRHWILALDGGLFRLPVAALGTGGGTFLIEEHSLRLVPSAHVLLSRARNRPETAGPFIGVGDAIYNQADPRWPRSGARREARVSLPRLAGTARELRACAAAWDRQQAPLLLEGSSACRRRLAEVLRASPAVLHVAAHIVPSQSDGRGGLIALSLQPGGEPELLSAAEIAGWRTNVGLAVLSGCSSGTAEALPGAGLMGLTRAWLAAGAGAVAASLWPTPDDSGELFLSFYHHWRRSSGGSPAAALQNAQLDMLRSNTWRAAAKYWAAYFIVTRG